MVRRMTERLSTHVHQVWFPTMLTVWKKLGRLERSVRDMVSSV